MTQKITSRQSQLGVAFSATKTTNQGITAATWTKVTWNSTTHDVGSDFDLANNRFVTPYSGVYGFSVRIGTNVASMRAIVSIHVNGTETIRGLDIHSSQLRGGVLSVDNLLLVKDDLVDVYHWNDGGQTIVTTFPYLNHFAGHLINRTD